MTSTLNHVFTFLKRAIMSNRKYTIIGISGTTNSGKSSVAAMLCRLLPHTEHMGQDKYFWEPGDPRVEWNEEAGFENWDKLSALDMDRMLKDVKQWIEKQQDNAETSILIIEGFLIFNHSELANLCNQKYVIKINKETCEKRRKKRVYNPPDVPGYFEKVVWPSYINYLKALKDQNDIEYIDGMTNLETLGQTILSKIQSSLQLI